jgi:Holliday junction DNA helicase RuvA
VIASLSGVIQSKDESSLVLEVNGVGWRLEVPYSVLEKTPAVGKPTHLLTRMLVREDNIQLFGFITTEQRELFDMLREVSGVGPRLALAVLSHLSPNVVRSAVVRNQPEMLTRVPGIGKKTAEKIVFNLKDRLPAPVLEEAQPSALDTEVLGVLTALGYSLVEAQTALQSIPDDAPEDVEARVRHALKYFS